MVNNKTLWDGVLAEMELTLSRANFGTWFRHTHIYKQDDGVVYISVPNAFVRDWLTNKYHKAILSSLRTHAPEIRSLEYIIAKLGDNQNKQATQQMESTPSTENTLGLQDLYINKESNLNPKYTFDTFVTGPFNEVAYAAAQAVIKNPGTNYNPLFIYGNTGLGKTHLIQSIGNYLKKLNVNKKVYYITSENFTIDYVNLVRSGKGNYFKEKYRKYDLLIMDDIQFFSGKEGTQEELFHLFNNFYENNKQIVFSSDKSPKFIDNIDDRLRSRFEGGMIVDVIKPDYESRLAILQTKAQTMNFDVPKEVLEYVASTVQDNVRELEGSLNTILCQSQAKKRMLTVSEIKNLIKNNIKPKKTISIKDVMKIVADFYNIEERFLYEKTRRKEVVKPRQIIMYLLREDFSTSYPYIGQKLGGRDHTTVIHAYEKIKTDLKVNQILTQEIEQIRTLLYNT
ncbi:MAG: chromosomal replication initiator protein DnaA [Candidatus Vogelbacteria bacterium]|nr:chromosomal replication initiator protein DnaA [Candidatus Vogelbacteria bacterium]